MKKIFIVLLVIATGIAIYFAFFRMNKKKAIRIIAEKTGTQESAHEEKGADYLIAWARAIKNNEETFKVLDANFGTSNGQFVSKS